MQGVRLVVAVSAVLSTATALVARSSCHCLPGDSCWPKKCAWDTLNNTIDGRLVATVPVGSVCHDPTYDEAACGALRAGWNLGETQYVVLPRAPWGAEHRD
jgi:hypothetical protein